jgi:serine/threonine protein kinase
VWSLGVITYMLLSGKPPFDGDNGKEIMQAIKRMKWNFSPDFNNVSRRAKQFISSCVSTVSHRPTSEEAAQHAWFGMMTEGSDCDESISQETIIRLRGLFGLHFVGCVCWFNGFFLFID